VTVTRRTSSSGTFVAWLVLSIPFLLAFHGWALKTAWNWFVPDITGWPRLGIAQAIGLSIVVGIARPWTSDDHTHETPAEFWFRMAGGVASVLLTLGIGWVVHEGMA